MSDTNCNYCIYQDSELGQCQKDGPCQGSVQSTGIEHYFHEFSHGELTKMYDGFRKFQLTELLVMKSILCNVIKEWYDNYGEHGKKKGKD